MIRLLWLWWTLLGLYVVVTAGLTWANRWGTPANLDRVRRWGDRCGYATGLMLMAVGLFTLMGLLWRWLLG